MKIDLTRLLEDRVHLHGFDCAALRALRTLKGVFGMMPSGPRIEWWEHSNTNPSKVKCIDCWNENADVQRAFERDFGPRLIVIRLRRRPAP